MKRPRFCGFCGQNLEKYDQKATFCMNCGKPLVYDIQTSQVSTRTPVSAQNGVPRSYQATRQPPSVYTPQVYSPYGVTRPMVEYAPTVESLKILIGKPQHIGNIFTKTSWMTIFIIIMSYLILEFISLQIISSKITFNVTDNFLQELSNAGFSTDLMNELGLDEDSLIQMLITILPLEFLGFNFIMAFVAGIGIHLMIGYFGVDKRKYSYRVSMTAIAFSSVPKILLGIVEIILAALYPVKTMTLDTMLDLDTFIDPIYIFNDFWVETGVNIVFGIMISLYIFWGLYKGLGIKKNSAIIITLIFAVFFTNTFSIFIDTILGLILF